MNKINIFKPIGGGNRKSFLLVITSSILLILATSLIVLFFKWILPNDLFNDAENFIKANELIVVIALGLAGIFFGIKAMYEAGDSLKKSEEILTAISSFFDNYEQATGRIEKLISSAKSKLLILVSLPAYGLIVDKRLGEDFYSALEKRFPDCQTGILDIQFICFSSELCETFEAKFKQDDASGFNKYKIFKKGILEGLRNVRALKKLSNPSYENLWALNDDSHIRLFIADDERAIFATVPDFNAKNPKETNIAGFETTEKKMVSILKKLFDEQKMSGSPLSDPEFKQYFN